MAKTLTISYEDNSPKGKRETSLSGTMKAAADAAAVNALVTAMKGIQAATPAYTGAAVSEKLAITVNAAAGGNEVERNNKWAVRCSSTLGISTHYVGCADFSLAVGDKLDITANPGLAFKTAFEACYTDKAGNALTVLEVYKANS